MYRVKIDIKNVSNQDAELLPGMPADAVIDIGKSGEWRVESGEQRPPSINN
jgi:hypothetical protein